ncbi:MAG: extracellular solute-binding protein, partial [Actinomycetota bacterium]
MMGPGTQRSTTLTLLALLAACLVAAMLLAAACGGGGTATTDGGGDEGLQDNSGDGTQLTLLDWGGYDTPEFRGPWDETHPDVKLNWVFANSDAEMFSKMRTGFDCDTVRPTWLRIYHDADLIQPIDTSKISNWANVNPTLAEVMNYDGEQYYVPTTWGFSAILYRTDKVTEPITSWADLWRPDLKGKVSVFDSGDVAVAMTAAALGIDYKTASQEELDQIEQKLIELGPNVKNLWVDSVQLDQQFAAGDIWVAAGAWSLSLLSAQDAGVPCEYVWPEEGMFSWAAGLGISKTTKDYDLALEFIDACLDPEAQAFIANSWGLGVGNDAAIPLIEPSLIEVLGLDDPDALFEQCIFLDPTEEERTIYNE